MPGAPGAPGVPYDADALRAENERLPEANERLRMLLEDTDAKIAARRAGRVPGLEPGPGHDR